MKADFLVCADRAVPGVASFPDKCSDCGTDVVRSERSRGMDVSAICVTCFFKRTEDAGEVEIAPAPYIAQDAKDLLGRREN